MSSAVHAMHDKADQQCMACMNRFFQQSQHHVLRAQSPEGEDVNADLGLARFRRKLLEEDVFRHAQPVLTVGVVQGGVVPLRDLTNTHIGH